MAKGRNSERVRKITYIAILTALVYTLQAISPMIKLSINSVALGLVPVIVGAAMYGPLCGMWLGLVFAGATFTTDLAAISPFLDENWPAAIITIVFKIVVAGAAAGFVYKLIAKKNEIVASIAASVVAPIVNTAIYVIFGLIFFRELVGGFAVIGVFILPNVIVEFLMCPLLAPVLIRVGVAFKRLK